MSATTFKQANAAKISQTLREAGISKATAYHPFANRTVDGFIVIKSRVRKDVTVTTSLRHDKARVQFEQIVAVLTEAGYEVVVDPHNGVSYGGGTYSLDVKAQEV